MSENPNGNAIVPVSLFTRLASVMQQIERVQKNGRNTSQSYDFVTDADVLDTVRAKLAEAGIAFIVEMTDVIQTALAKGTHTLCKFQYSFVLGETGETSTRLWTGEAIDYGDKGISKAATSAEKYFLLKTFMISTGEDPDENSPERNEKKPAIQKNAAPAQTPTEPPPAPAPATQSRLQVVQVTDAPKTAQNGANKPDWTPVWAKFKAAGFRPGNGEDVEKVFEGRVDELTPDEALKVLDMYK